MCFSPEASFTSAGVLAFIGTLTLKKALLKARVSPLIQSEQAEFDHLWYFAVIPFVFAFQQFLEGILWVTLLREGYSDLLHRLAAQGFLTIAAIFWPIFIPYVLYKNENHQNRKQLLFILLCLGILVGISGALSMLLLGNEAQILAHNIVYPIPLNSQSSIWFSFEQMTYWGILGLYVLVTIGASFVSSKQYIWIFGVLSLLAFVVAQIFYAHAFGSVWCFFAAIISMISYFVVKRAVFDYDKSGQKLETY